MLDDVRQAALIYLYRLLFLLYAEDRDLLPVNDSRYDDYGLRKSVRDDIDKRTAAGDAFSTIAGNYYNHIKTLCRQVDEGDPSIGLPPYNGGLFAQQAAPMLEQVHLPDAVLAPIIHNLSRTRGESGPPLRQLPRHDGAAARLHLRAPARGANPSAPLTARSSCAPTATPARTAAASTRPNPSSTSSSSAPSPRSWRNARAAFHAKAAALQSDTRAKTERVDELRPLDPAAAALNLKLLDPAMGSGHFLVTAVDYLSDAIADLVEYAPTAAPWLEDAYTSPLLDRIASIRTEILARAGANNWVIDIPQLTDQAIIRRMVLKRCIYGVDKNPLTVELAKVSLWLHSFTVGAPLSFLDHHLRCGDSLIGLRVHDAVKELSRLGGLSSTSAVQAAENATAGMQRIEEMSDADIAEVEQSAALFREVEKTTSPLRGLLNTLCGVNWLAAGMKKRQRAEFEAPLQGVIVSQEEKAFSLLSNGPDSVDPADPVRQHTTWPDFTQTWRAAAEIADRENFLHWEVAFPGVWHRWQDDQPAGGFDAIIGNPPWDRIKLQEVEWFATRSPELALAPTAAARRRGIKQLRDGGDPLASEFDAAKLRADRLGQLIRASGHYPLLGGGDINLYSLFVERAMRLAKPDGIVGLLTPSGIFADKTAAPFFQTVSTSGRVGSLFDFENRKIFFSDVHGSFKFCVLIFGGEERCFGETECSFFLHDTAAIDDPDRCFPLAPADFARVNPNTGTAPVFRTRRDADITRRIYQRHPVLVDRSADVERRAWPIGHLNQFHATHDSYLFQTSAQLDERGFYPIKFNRWKKGKELYLPLYEGKMVSPFDHRSASIEMNPDNLNRQGQPKESTLEELKNPNFLPEPAYWVPEAKVSVAFPQSMGWTLVYRRITAPTNSRTTLTTILPWCGVSYTIPMLRTSGRIFSATDAACLQSVMSSFCFDYVSRQKLQAASMSLTSLEQLPVIAPADYDCAFGHTTARDLVCHHVLRLTYTAHDMAPFARDLGYDGPPFIWNEEKRRHLRARLDALYFHLYGLSRADAAYILDTFPIVRRHDKAAFGTYRTKKMVLAYYNALAAGDTDTDVVV